MYAILALFLLAQLLLPAHAFAGDAPVVPKRDPGEVILEYHKAFRQMNWTLAARHSHPASLKAFKEKILTILMRTEQQGRDALLAEFSVTQPSELEAMSPVDFFAAACRRRWRGLTAGQQEAIQRSRIEIVGTSLLDGDRCIVRYRSQASSGKGSEEKEHRYLVRRYHGEWRIDLSDHVAAAGKK